MSCPRDCLILAGIGGVIPTVSRLASTYVTDPSTPLPEPGLFFGLSLFFVIGAVLAFAFSETNMRQAFILGVCAPGIITNIVAGANDADADPETASLTFTPFISVAYAQDPTVTSSEIKVENVLFTSNAHESQRKIVVISHFVGAGAWDLKNIPLLVTAIQKDGVRVNLGSFPAYQESIELEVPENASAVQIRAAGFTNQVSLPEQAFSKAVINTHLKIEGKKDFFWALGAKRRPRVVSVNSVLTQVEMAQPPLTVKSLLGERVNNPDGTPAGKVVDIEFGPSGQINRLVIEKSVGEFNKVLPSNIQRKNSELFLQP